MSSDWSNCRSRMPLETSMDDLRMLWVSREWHSHLMRTHLLMYASRITFLDVSSSRSPLIAALTIPLAKRVPKPFRHVELDIDIGADAKDWSAVQATEKLKPVETELRRMEEMVAEIVAEMDYLRTREQKLRDTNESTNTRVKWFAFGTMGMLVALGAWQVVYLRAYFRHVIQFLVAGEFVLTSEQVQASYLDVLKKCSDGTACNCGKFYSLFY